MDGNIMKAVSCKSVQVEYVSPQRIFICSKSATETLENGVKYVFIVNFECISPLLLLFILLNSNKWMLTGAVLETDEFGIILK